MALPGSSPKFHVLLLVTLVLAFCIPSFGQSENATLSGTITDPSGASVQGAQVKLTNVNTGITATVPSNESGLYVLTNIHPGQYRMVVEKAGFRQVVLTDITLNVQDVLSRNFKLQVGVVGESVTVSGATETVNTTSAAVSTVVDNQFVENMPLNGRSFQSLIELTPGIVLTPSSQNAPGQFSVNGQRNNANYFTIDGVSANIGSTPSYSVGQTMAGVTPGLTSGGGTNGLVSVDAMQEFRIQTSSYAPEYGRMPGAQISIVTKGGTNRWHGTAYDYLRNDFLDARNYFNQPPEPQPALRQNDFGGTVGGPIWKDKTFFFFSYEGLRLLQPNTEDSYFLMPASRTNVSAAWAPIVNSLPIPDTNANLLDPSCDNVTIPCNGEIKAAYSNPSRFNAYSVRIDHNLTKNITAFARYNHVPSTQGQNNFQEVTNTIANTDTATAGLTMTLGPQMMNDFRANWSKATGFLTITLDNFHGATIPAQSVLYPPGFNFGNAQAYFAISVDGAYQEVRGGSRDTNTQRQWNFVDTLSRTVGAHQLKFGVDFRRVNPSTNTDNGDSLYAWGGGPHPDGWWALQNGYVDTLLSGTSIPITAHMDNWSFFGQDTWKATRRLTLTYGLRWDINTPPVSTTPGRPLYAVQGVFDSNPLGLAPAGTPLWHTQYDAFGPRIGAAFQITPKTVVRGGFGLFYDLGYGGSIGGTMGGDFPYSIENFANGYDANGNPLLPFDFTNPIYQPLPFSTTITANALQVDAVDPHLRLPVTYQWNGAFERELGTNQSISATYVGANGQRLLYGDRIVPPGSIFQTSGSGGFATATRNAAYSHYNALQLQFKRRMSHGLQALVSYSLAKSSDLASTDSGFLFFPSVSVATLPPLTPSDFDIRHSASAAISYEIPTPSWGKAGHAALGGWALDGIFRASSGPPLDVAMGSYNSAVTYNYVRPALVPGQPIWIPDPTEPAGKALNPDAFTLAPNGASNDALRNTIRSPYGIAQIDLAMRRRFNITERVKLDFRAEYFNLFNHPMFYGPDVFWGFCYSQPCSGQQFSTFGKVDKGNTLNVGLGGGGLNGGQSALYAPGGPRSGQLTLKLTF